MGEEQTDSNAYAVSDRLLKVGLHSFRPQEVIYY